MLHLDRSPAGHGTTLADASGWGNDGTLFSSDTTDKSSAGYIDGALQFDGYDDYVMVPHSDSLNPEYELTVMAWVNLKDPNGNQKIVGKTPIQWSGYLLGVVDGKLYAEIWDTDSTHHEIQTGNIPAQTWTHLAVTWLRDGDMVGYINGQEIGRTSASDRPIGTSSSPLIIGAAPWDTYYFKVNGRIDEVAILDRALGEEDVRAVYESGFDALLQE